MFLFCFSFVSNARVCLVFFCFLFFADPPRRASKMEGGARSVSVNVLINDLGIFLAGSSLLRAAY